MKKRFTRILAALALLLFVAPPMMGWGQTTYTMTLDNNADGNNNVHWLTLNTTLTYQDVSWTTNVTPSNCYIGTSKSFAQVGSKNNPATQITISTDDFAGKTITGVSLTGYCTNNTGPTLTITAGNTTILNAVPLVKTTSTTYSPQSMQAVQLGQNEALSFIFNSSASAGICMSEITVTYITGSSATATNTTITVPTNFNTDVYTSTTAGQLTATVTYDNNGTPTNVLGATVTWASSDEDVATVDAYGNVALVAAGTTNITATFAGNDDYATSYDTYELTVTNSDPNVPGTANNPYTAAAIIAMGSDLPSGTVYVRGIVSRFHDENILGDDENHRYYISNDGSTTNGEIRVYKGKGLNNEAFANEDDVLVGDNVVICGELSRYSNMTQFNANNYIYSLTRPAQYTLTNAMTNVEEYFVFVGETRIEFDNNNQAQVRAGATVSVSLTMEDCYSLTSLTVNGSTTDVTVIEPGIYYSFVMPEGDATIGVSATQATEHTLTVVGLNNVTYTAMLAGVGSEVVTLTNNQATLCEGINVDIAGLRANTGFSLQSVTLNDGTTTTSLELVYGVYHFTMPSSNATLTFNTTKVTTAVDELTRDFTGIPNQTSNTTVYSEWSGKKGSSSTAIYAGQSAGTYNSITLRSNNSNSGIVTTTSGGKVKKVSVTWNSNTASGRTLDVYGKNTPYSDATDLYGNNNPNQGTNIGSIVYGTSTELTVDDDYTYIGLRSKSGAMYIDKIEITWDVNYSATMTVDAYNKDAETGWYFIASPFDADPSYVANLNTNLPVSDQDLYYYEEESHMWRNYKQEANAAGFNFANGTGYLYANSQNVTLTFAGTSIVANDTKAFELSYTANAAPLAGWNLVGNPFNCKATITDGNGVEKPFYVVNHRNVVANTGSIQINPCAGVMVQAARAGESVVFTKVSENASASQINQLEMTVAQQVMSRGTATSLVHDNAIVNFNAGSQLEKFPFNADAAELFIPQDGKDYAIVSSETQGEMPVNFKAKENGTYTLSIDVEGMEMKYLHLIDNKTGNDVDLLQTPSYSFEAKTTDYESRFKLVFVANNEDSVSTGTETFAFFSNGSFVINNEGNAELQVIDITGRIVKSESINGCANVNVNAAPGVYMLRLINGDNVKTQKVVVK